MPPAQNYGTTELRITWETYWCKQGGKWADIDFFGKKVGGVPSVMVDAYAALEQALTATGYKPPEKCQSLWSYVVPQHRHPRAGRRCTPTGSPSTSTPITTPRPTSPPTPGGSTRTR